MLLARLTILAAGGYVAPRALRITPALAGHRGGGDGHSLPPGKGPPAP
jgi:hypothetical protein